MLNSWTRKNSRMNSPELMECLLSRIIIIDSTRADKKTLTVSIISLQINLHLYLLVTTHLNNDVLEHTQLLPLNNPAMKM